MIVFIPRTLGSQLKEMAEWFPIVSLTGPRQSGKSTLAKHEFPDHAYLNLEDPQLRAQAIDDPVSFIRNRPEHLIIDEAQYAPDLFSMLQVVSDERGTAGQYILSGSQNFLMMKEIGQSLAGRVGLLKLLPLSYKELQAVPDHDISVDAYMFKGGYPRLYSSDIPPTKYFPSYIDTYIERDVTNLLDVRQKSAFHKLLILCAQNAGKLVNYSSLANAAGLSVPTVKSWLSVLETSYLIFMLQPYFSNERKRITKTPKLYFYDTGLLCNLLSISSEEQLIQNSQIGAIFENLIVTEAMKKHLNAGETPQLYFYRDDSKREIDLLDFTSGGEGYAYEIKSSCTFHDRYATQLNSVGSELGIPPENRNVILRVEDSYKAKTCNVLAAKDWLVQ